MDARANPDELLRYAVQEERRARRGKLTVFFGAAPGVGKTYAMLEAARTERDLKRDVVVGVVETHGRYDTGALVIGLELVPRRRVEHRGIVLEELDLDAALARRPGLILVDELAHTNAPGSRHAKRWQDVDELLDAGIDVYSTLNVQLIESLKDVVAQVTGVVVRETVPDRVLEDAAEFRLIDLPPDDLLERLSEGKVYLPEKAEHAIENFFRKGNLIALRELALRSTAERVDAQMRTYRAAHGIRRAWPTAERVLVCVSASPSSARLVRAARRLATSLHADVLAAHVETPRDLRLSDAARNRLAENLRLAEQLGAQIVTLRGDSAAEEAIGFANAHNVTKIVVGKPAHARWLDVVRASFLQDVVRLSGDVDVYVITGEEGATAGPVSPLPPPSLRPGSYVASAAIALAATGIAWILFGRRQLADVVMIYLLGIILVALRFGYGPSIFASVVSVLLLDFFFVPPYLSFAVSDFQHGVTFAVMFVVAAVISGLTMRVRQQADAARNREKRTAEVYAMSRELAATRAVRNLAAVAVDHLRSVFGAKVALLYAGLDGHLENLAVGEGAWIVDDKERGAVEWVFAHEGPAGLGTETLPSMRALYLPLRGSQERVGVLGVVPSDPKRFADAEQRALLDVFANQVGSALERARLADLAQKAHLEIEAERLRSTLLSSVSSDLATPISVITAAASTLVGENATLEPSARLGLATSVLEESQRLDRLVRNLHDMTRLSSGTVHLTKEVLDLASIVAAARLHLQGPLRGRTVETDVPPGLLVSVDRALAEQVLVNVLENAAKFSPANTPISIAAHRSGDTVVVEIGDRGPGVPPELADKIFEKFYRLPREQGRPGTGLGLAISRAIVDAHGGRIWVDARDGGGAVFRFTFPIPKVPPPDAPSP